MLNRKHRGKHKDYKILVGNIKGRDRSEDVEINLK
jgi:hypothetical protein